VRAGGRAGGRANAGDVDEGGREQTAPRPRPRAISWPGSAGSDRPSCLSFTRRAPPRLPVESGQAAGQRPMAETVGAAHAPAGGGESVADGSRGREDHR